MRRFFARNLLFVIALNLLVKPVWILAIDRTVQNRVGHASYGIYQALFNLGLVFQILLDFGINYYNSSTLAQFPGKLKTLFPAMLSARLVLSFLYLIIVTLLALLLGYRGWQINVLLGVLFIQVLSSVLLFLRSNMSGLHKFKADGLLSVIDRFLMILLCGSLLFYSAAGSFRIEWFVLAQIACYAAAIVIGFIMLKRLTGVSLSFSFRFPEVMRVIKKSLPFAFLVFLMSVYTRSDTLLVERLGGHSGQTQAGIYAAAYRLLDVGNMFGIMFGTMLLPLFGRMLRQGNDVHPIIRLCVNLLLPASLLVTVLSVLFRSEIMHQLYKDTADVDVKVFGCLMLAFPAFCLSNVYATLLTANGDLRLLSLIAFLGVVLNLSLHFTLIPQYLALGAAFTTFCTQTVLIICIILFARSRLKLKINLRWLSSFVLFLLLLVAAGMGVRTLGINWIWQLSALTAIGLALIFCFGYVSPKALKQLVSRD